MNGRRTYSFIAPALAALVLAPASAEAIPILATYQFSAQNFLDSNSNPPPPPTSNAVAGTFTFTFDDAALPQHEIVPLAVVGVDLTYNDGSMMDFDETNSGVDVDFGNAAGEYRITFGATVSAVCCMIGLTNDFRLRFDIFLADGTVKAVVDPFTFNSITDPFYTGPTTMTLLSYQVIPEPGTALLFGLGLTALAMQKRKRR